MDFPPSAGTDAPPAPSQGEAPLRALPAIRLQALHAQDPLRRKWQLGTGLPPVSEPPGQLLDAPSSDSDSHHAHLRLRTIGQQEAGMPWECHVPFSELAREGGMVLGQCPHNADIVLPHENISPRHALLEISETGLVVTDLDSAHGTCVDEWELSPCQRRIPLADGAALILGKTCLRVEYIL